MNAIQNPSPAVRLATRANAPRVDWLVAPTLVFLAGTFLLPIGLMMLISALSGNPLVQDNVHVTAANYSRFAADPYHWEALWTTFRIGLVVTVGTLVLGYPLAHFIARQRSPWFGSVLLALVITPMLTGLVVRTFAWMTLLGDRGVINNALMSLGVPGAPLPLMYNEFGVYVAMIHIELPFMVLTLMGIIARIDQNLELAARNLGASRFRAFIEVTLPLSVPGILAGCLLVFAQAISFYITPLMMGGSHVTNLPILIYEQVSASFNIGFASAMGTILLVVSFCIIVFYNAIDAYMRKRGA